MLPTGNRTGSVKMMSIRTGKLVTRDQFKLLPMPSTVITRLNEMAASEGRKIGLRTNMVYNQEGGLRKPDAVTYIRPTAKFSTVASVDPAESIDGFTVGNLADNLGSINMDSELGIETYPTDDVENDIRAMDAQNDVKHDGPPAMLYNAEDFDLGPLQEFSEPATEEFSHRHASVPLRHGVY